MMNDANPPGRKQSAKRDPYLLALRLLGRRDYSSADLRRKLTQRGFSADKIDTALERCRELGYLDDRRFAAQTARSLTTSGRAVGRRLQQELKKRGIESSLAEEAEAAIESEVDHDALIAGLLARRYPDFDYARAVDAQRRRVIQFFLRRGFSLGEVLAVLKTNEES